MRVSIVITTRYVSTPDGVVWASFPATTLVQRYLAVFDSVNIIARVQPMDARDGKGFQVNENGISVTSIPSFIGPFQYLLKQGTVRKSLKHAIAPDDAVIFREYGVLATPILKQCLRAKRPFGFEVIGDPVDVFAPGTIKHPLRGLFHYLAPKAQRRLCSLASAVSYVTKHTLQERYPASPNAFTTHYSSIQLEDQYFVKTPRSIDAFSINNPRILFAGKLDQRYKGAHILIDAFQRYYLKNRQGILVIAGDGKYRLAYETQAQNLGLREKIVFLGHLAGPEAVQQELLKADLLVLPSLTEGLPRVVIEAMACGTPCIASSVGGIPELLQEEDMFLPGSVDALYEKMTEVLSCSNRLAAMSQRYLEAAKEYHGDILAQRRIEFYQYLYDETRKWVNGGISIHHD